MTFLAKSNLISTRNLRRTFVQRSTTFTSSANSIQGAMRMQSATHCNTLQHTGTHHHTLQHNATHCNTLQYFATHGSTLRHTAAHCGTLQHTAAHCSTPQHTAAHCNLQQHTATHGHQRVRWDWIFLERTRILSGIQFTKAFHRVCCCANTTIRR